MSLRRRKVTRVSVGEIRWIDRAALDAGNLARHASGEPSITTTEGKSERELFSVLSDDEAADFIKRQVLYISHHGGREQPTSDHLERCDALVTRLGFLLPSALRADRIDEWRDELSTARERGCSLTRRTISICLRALPAEVIRARFLRRRSRQEA